MSDAMSVEAIPLIARRIRCEAPANVDLVLSTSRALNRGRGDDLAIGVFPHGPKELFGRELSRATMIYAADKRNVRMKN